MQTAAAERVSFDVSNKDRDIIQKIADRALGMERQFLHHRDRRTRTDIEMDITATHASGNPLRLQALLEADDFNFAHDIFGIANCLNRATGQLENCFRPRFSQPEAR